MNSVRECAKALAASRRALVIGCSGSGKSTLAQALSRRLDLPYVSMDRAFYWLPGWKMRPSSEVRSMIATTVAEERWLMDGSGKSTLDIRLPRTDVVIWLHLPRWQCLARVFCRVMRYWGKSRPDMAEGCPERLDPEFLRYIWTFDRKQSPHIRANLQKYGADVPVFILRSSAEVAALLDAISLDEKADAAI